MLQTLQSLLTCNTIRWKQQKLLTMVQTFDGLYRAYIVDNVSADAAIATSATTSMDFGLDCNLTYTTGGATRTHALHNSRR